ncbi:hypothetical protein [Actinoplanes sp. NPDC026619]|uniref:hypothetical protein n=1 Tax=Actinoplanes sp. NPDC026619 TaxID=3155798 RepID=UPI0033FBAE3E
MSELDFRRPLSVEIGASLVAVVGVISVGRVLYGVVVNLGQDQWSAGARGVFLVLNSFILLVGVFILVLAYHVRKGRMWAWITSLVVMTFTILFGALLLLITAVGGGIPLAGGGIVLVGIAAMVTLTAPRTARAYFSRPPAYPQPPAYGYPPAYGHPPVVTSPPAQPGQWPGHPPV